MSKTKYQILFHLTVKHSYFKQNQCTCLDFKATNSTLNLIQRYGMKVRKQITGFEFYINTSESANQYLKYIENISGESSFDFDINTSNSNFNIFTDFPINWVGSILYDSGNKINTSKKNVLNIKAEYKEPDNSSSLAKLKIDFQDIIKSNLEDSPAKFEIAFNARPTQWNYYIINKSSIKLDSPKIEGKSNIKFEGPFNKTVSQTGEEALLFTSGNYLIPLSEVPKFKFNLINESKASIETIKKTLTSKTIYTGLPNPDPGKIEIGEDAMKNLISSSMYVYV